MSFSSGNVNYITNLYSLYTVACKMAKDKSVTGPWKELKDRLGRKLDEECASFIQHDNALLEGKRRFGTDAAPVQEPNPFYAAVSSPSEVVMSCEPDSTE